MLFSGYLSIIPKGNFTIAAVTQVSCNSRCQFSYGAVIAEKDWQGNETVGSQCSKECPICRPKQINLESSQSMGIDCQYTDTCYCESEDFKSVHEGGSDQIVDYAKPITEKKEITPGEPFKDLTDKVNNIIPYAIGLGGLIAFILMVFGGLQIILSGGNPEKVKAGKEIITSAIAGLLLIIFSVFILKLIGVDLLNLPGFN